MGDNEIQEHLNKMKLIQDSILEYLDEEKNDDKSFEDLIKKLDDQQIRNKEDLDLILHLISNLSDNYHRIPDFFTKIEKIISAYQIDIKKYFPDSFLLNLFINSKMLLLYFFKNKLIKPTNKIFKRFRGDYYFPYLYQYIFIPISNSLKGIRYCSTENHIKYTSEPFLSECETGLNSSQLCQLIRNDSVVEFIKYINETNLDVNSKIKPTESESNLRFLNEKTSIIDYAIYFGAIQIVKYLINQKVSLNSNHWKFALCSNNQEMIYLLEESKVYASKKALLERSIEIHDVNLINYFNDQINDLTDSDIEDLIITAIKNYNFSYLADHFIDYMTKNETKKENIFKVLCSNHYEFLVDFFLKNKWINVNESNINELFIYAFEMDSLKVFDFLFTTSGIQINDRIFDTEYFFEDPYGNSGTGSSEFYRYPQEIKKRTLLHVAVQKESTEIVRFLLSKPNIDVNARIFGGGGKRGVGDGERSCLHIAIKKGNTEIVRLLLSRRETKVNTRCINEIINNNFINFRIKEETALCMAIKRGYVEIVELLLQRKNIDINARSFNVFYYSFQKTKPSMWHERDYEKKADNIEVDTCFKEEYKEHYKRDSSAYRDMRSGGDKTALHIAIEKGHTDIVALLLKQYGIDVNERSIMYSTRKHVNTPLYEAVRQENIEVIKLLINMPGIDIYKKSSVYAESRMPNRQTAYTLESNETPLELATKKELNDIIDILKK